MRIKKDIAIFLAARSGSKRLPNKHFLKVNSRLKMIDLCILRLKIKKFLRQKNVYLFKNKKEDKKFEKICKFHKIKIFRGSTNNVLKRIIDCAKKNSVETIIRITADCPLIDSALIDKCIKSHFRKKCDYSTNTLDLTFPDGQDIEIINIDTLLKSQKLSKSKINKEHVTPFIRKSKKFKKNNYRSFINYSNRRWTVDNIEDFLFLKKVIKYFSPKIYFSWLDLIKAEKIDDTLVNIKNRT